MKNIKVLKLDTAKRLQKVAEEKGVDLPESEFVWVEDFEAGWVLVTNKKECLEYFEGCQMYRTYLPVELLEILPDGLTLIKQGDDTWEACLIKDSVPYSALEETPAEALGKLLIKLIEEDIYEKH